MELIIDSNIVFSALLKKENNCKRIIFSDNFEIYSCNFLFVEIFKHKNKIQLLSELSEEEILIQIDKILSRVNFVNDNLISTNIYYQAFILCKDYDPSDTPFIALLLFLNVPLLTGDKVIYEPLKQKNFNILAVKDIINLI